MKRVLITACLLAAMAALGLATVAQAVQPASKPFIHVSTSPSRLNLGTAVAPGFYDIPKALTLNVDSNCLHGPIMISASNLRRHPGGFIPAERIFVRSSTTCGFVNLGRPVAVSVPKSGSHKIVLDVQVRTGFSDMAGRYSGGFTVTVMPPV